MRVFIVHRWDGTPQSDWYKWVRQELEQTGFQVHVPRMPHTTTPKIQEWISHLRKEVGTSDKDTYFIGHSIGCQAIMRYLETLPTAARIGGIILVAGWFTLQNLESKEMAAIARPWLTTPIDFSQVRKKTNNITVFLSPNDPYVNLKENKALFERNLQATVIIEKGKGHFTAGERVTRVPEVVREIKVFSGHSE